MEEFIDGFERAIDEFFISMLRSTVANIFLCTIYLTVSSPTLLILIALLNTSILLLEIENIVGPTSKMSRWKSERVLGWIARMIFLISFNLTPLNISEMLIALIMPLFILLVRILQKL